MVMSPVPSDQVLLDVSYKGGLMFDIKFTYLQVFDIAWDSDLTVLQQHTEITTQTLYGK